MAGDNSAARIVNRDILINELDLRQVSNTTIYLSISKESILCYHLRFRTPIIGLICE
ncbi:hypothetical protein SAMN05443253_12317 [Bacillus sp. OK048]|nr:hypothetical protein SAMN05443253_12317 [Bacillus sp. OK048]